MATGEATALVDAPPRAGALGDDGDPVTFEGAQRPDRTRWVDSHGLPIAVYEWGDPDDLPLLCAHGGFDFAGTYDVFAPMLAAAGWRVVAWDQRGHGDSAHAHLYSWDADLRDAVAVLDSIDGAHARTPAGSPAAVPVLGHSKGGGLTLQLADALPHRVSALVNLDGMPSARSRPDISDHDRSRLLASELGAWLDHRRGTATKERRAAATIEDLAVRRAKMNPRLPLAWLRYLVSIGARRDPDGWRWKIDPSLRLGGFGPWRPEWSMQRLPGLAMPLLAVLGLELEVMGWGTLPEDVRRYLPAGARFEAFDGIGHFLHIEQPRQMADLVLEFLS